MNNKKQHQDTANVTALVFLINSTVRLPQLASRLHQDWQSKSIRQRNTQSQTMYVPFKIANEQDDSFLSSMTITIDTAPIVV